MKHSEKDIGVQQDERVFERIAAMKKSPEQTDQIPSATAGMNMAQRILHVGGRNNAAGYVEFGSVQAVEALVRHVIRDLPQQDPVALIVFSGYN